MEFVELLSGLIALASGPLVTVVMSGLRKVATVDGLDRQVKQAIVLILAFAVVKLNAVMGLTMPIDAAGWIADILNTFITAGLSFGAYNVFKPKTVK